MKTIDRILGESSEFSEFLSVVSYFSRRDIFTSTIARTKALDAMRNYEKSHALPEHVSSWMYDILHADPDDEASQEDLEDGLGWCVIEAIQRGYVPVDPSVMLIAGLNPLDGGFPLYTLTAATRPYIEAVAKALKVAVQYVLDRATDVFEATADVDGPLY